MTGSRPPVRSAVLVALAVLTAYLITLAPTVTFWDAGEFITAARTLGIPHPPGTPLFVLVANVWGRALPLGNYAWRINLLSAVCSAAAAGFWFLVGHDVVTRLHPDVDARSRRGLATLAGIAAALLGSFSFSVWQNATEAEVYASATLIIAVVAWIAMQWRGRRSDSGGSRLLLLAIYLGALSTANHVMALLVGPALVAVMIMEARRVPLETPAERAAEWSRIWVVAAAWLLLLGIGTGNTAACAAGAAALALAGARARRARQFRFALAALAMVIVGASTLAFLVLRARQHPWLDSGNPIAWQGVLDALRRVQYPPRTPFDDPTVLHGPGNPGRTLVLLAYQIANYAQYFDWQWAGGLGNLGIASYPRLAITLAMVTLGVHGAFAQRRSDPSSFALVGALFLVTGPALLLYLNFKPGPSIGWDRWLASTQHEVRDRDYFFVASFIAWGIWVAIALADVARAWIPRVRTSLRPAMSVLFAWALVPLACNYRIATRRDIPDATLARDFAHALLQSAPAGAVLFTYGDNDTFPLWYAQQVEGFRPDVTVICLSLAQARWYVRQFENLHAINPALIDTLRPFRATRPFSFDVAGRYTARVEHGAAVTPVDVMVIEILRKNAGRRPIAWSITATDNLFGLGPDLVQQGLALILPVSLPDSTRLISGIVQAPGGSRLDLPATLHLIDSDWWFGRLESEGSARLDPNLQVVAATVAAPMTQAGLGLLARGDTSGGIRLLQRAIRLANDSLAGAVFGRLGR